ncbi:glycosyltransferase family 87 protein [Aquabacterium sp.]|uniref:glycosyltransferase family 87 protein n=1 Tax=Aquabacterium sp. TaxID=1872578 RepID=UPI0035C6F8D5
MTHLATLFRAQRRWLLLFVSTAVLAWLGHIHFATAQRAAALPDSTDFYKFFLSAQRVNNGQSMYWLVPPRAHPGDPCHPSSTAADRQHLDTQVPSGLLLGGDDPCLGPNLNPPIFTALTLPLTHLPYEQAWWAWSAASIAAGILGVVLLVCALATDTRQRTVGCLAGCAALFLCYPTLANASLGQVGTLLLPPLVLAWRALRRRDELWGGVWLGLVAGFKPFLLILLPALWVQQRRRACMAAAATVAGMGLLGWALFGSDMHRHYLLVAADVTWSGTNWNASWAGVIERILSGQADSVLPQGSALARAWASGLSLLTVALVCWRLRQARHSPREDADALMALGLPASLLASPLGWSYYFPMLALPWILLWRHSAQMPTPRPWRMGLLLPLTLSAPTIAIQASPRPETPSVWWGVDSIYFYALVCLLGLGIALLQMKPERRNEQGAP